MKTTQRTYRKRGRTDLNVLQKVSPEEWVLRTSKIHKKIREQVINIIWWDFFANKTQADKWPHFDHVIKQRIPVTATNAVLYKALIKCGYTDRIAKTRLNMIAGRGFPLNFTNNIPRKGEVK
jgi:hypothetical protein